MKEKVNPMSDLFAVAVNAAAIRDFKRAYWFGEGVAQTWIRDGMSQDFISRLAVDAADAKAKLRAMMVRSPYWRESLQAWKIPVDTKIPVTKTDVRNMIVDMWRGWSGAENPPTTRQYHAAIEYFMPNGEDNPENVNAVAEILGRPPRGKKSKVFKKVSEKLGVYDNTSGSVYQSLEARLFTTLGSEFDGLDFQIPKKFALYVSLNPAHWLSMSNPKHESRRRTRDTLTSCHSFNGSYRYKSGCVGYARDEVSLLAFTAANDGDAIFNRKTARQVFMYKNGALLQSRLYTADTGVGYGGVTEASHWEYKVFLKVIQAEISRCENGRDWSPAEDYRNGDNGVGVVVSADVGYGGYPDWEEFSNRGGMIRVCVLNSRREAQQGLWKDQIKLTAGAAGLSIYDAREVARGAEIA